MIEWGKNQNLKKFLDQNLTPKKSNLRAIKISRGTTRPGYAGTIIIPQKTYYNQATKNTVAKIFLPKKIAKSKISNPKNPLIIPVT